MGHELGCRHSTVSAAQPFISLANMARHCPADGIVYHALNVEAKHRFRRTVPRCSRYFKCMTAVRVCRVLPSLPGSHESVCVCVCQAPAMKYLLDCGARPGIEASPKSLNHIVSTLRPVQDNSGRNALHLACCCEAASRIRSLVWLCHSTSCFTGPFGRAGACKSEPERSLVWFIFAVALWSERSISSARVPVGRSREALLVAKLFGTCIPVVFDIRWCARGLCDCGGATCG